MLNSKLKIGIGFIFIFQLVGCGSDEESKSSSKQNNTVDLTANIQSITSFDNGSSTLTSEQEQSLIVNAKEEMDQLIANSDFYFTSKQQVSVKLDLVEELNASDQIDQRAYVSIYRDYQLLDSGVFYPDSSSRVIAGDLQSGIFNHSFVSLKSESTYLVEVWFYNGDQPLQKEITVVDHSLVW